MSICSKGTYGSGSFWWDNPFNCSLFQVLYMHHSKKLLLWWLHQHCLCWALFIANRFLEVVECSSKTRILTRGVSWAGKWTHVISPFIKRNLLATSPNMPAICLLLTMWWTYLNSAKVIELYVVISQQSFLCFDLLTLEERSSLVHSSFALCRFLPFS